MVHWPPKPMRRPKASWTVRCGTASAFGERRRLRHKSLALDPGGKPSDDAATGMVADFLARGGLVIVCPPAEATLNDAEGRHKKSG